MNPSRIVITGLIASGKSSLLDILRENKQCVIDADKVNRKLLEKGNINYELIKKSAHFDKAFVNDNLDKKILADIIFNDEKKRKILNDITHPNIIKAIEDEISLCKKNKVFVEIPLFFQMEVKFAHDLIVLVVADRDIQIKRLAKRDNIDKEYAIKKLESQDMLKFMIENSDIIIDNSKDLDNLTNQAISLIKGCDYNESIKNNR